MLFNPVKMILSSSLTFATKSISSLTHAVTMLSCIFLSQSSLFSLPISHSTVSILFAIQSVPCPSFIFSSSSRSIVIIYCLFMVFTHFGIPT
jgi:hypothetical protein